MVRLAPGDTYCASTTERLLCTAVYMSVDRFWQSDSITIVQDVNWRSKYRPCSEVGGPSKAGGRGVGSREVTICSPKIFVFQEWSTQIALWKKVTLVNYTLAMCNWHIAALLNPHPPVQQQTETLKQSGCTIIPAWLLSNLEMVHCSARNKQGGYRTPNNSHWCLLW